MSSNFCVYLTIYLGEKLPTFYIGYCNYDRIRYGYHGTVSSKLYKQIWKNELKENPHLFKTRIFRNGLTKKAAVALEAKLQRAFQVHRNPMFINKSITNDMMFSGKANTDYLSTSLWVNNGTISKRVQQIEDGWIKGRLTFSRPTVTIMHMGDKQIMVRNEDIERRRLEGFEYGMSSTNLKRMKKLGKTTPKGQFKNKIWITDGQTEQAHHKDDPIPDGWRRGRHLTSGAFAKRLASSPNDKPLADPCMDH